MKILFVDDESDLLELGEIFLKKEEPELDIDTTISPTEGIKKIEKKEYDAIVSDYDMPSMNGIEFYQELEKKGCSNIPFIVFTGSGEEELRDKCLNVGADHFMRKGSNPKAKFSKLANSVKKEIEEYNNS